MAPSPSFGSCFSNLSEGLSARIMGWDIEAVVGSSMGALLTTEVNVGEAVADMGTPAAGKLTATEDIVRLMGWI